ncbi:MAG: DUF1003 domain-containing protein [bacterium]
MSKDILSLDEIKNLRKPVTDTYKVHKYSLSNVQKFAIWITESVGTMGFFFIIAVWTLSWLGWNTLGPSDLRFDPFPAFVLWLFLSNMIQLSLLPLIMVGQNLQSKYAERRSEDEYHVNLKVEREVETIIAHLENQEKLIDKILQSIESKTKS